MIILSGPTYSSQNVRQIWESTLSKSDYLVGHFGRTWEWILKHFFLHFSRWICQTFWICRTWEYDRWYTWSRQTGNRNLMGSKTLPTIWHTYMKLVTKYQISAINSCWEKCNEKWAYMFNVYKNQQSRQTGNRNLMGSKTFPTIWGTYILWETFLNPSDSYFLFADCWFLYTLNIYAHFSLHFSQQLLMAEIWYLVTSFILQIFWTI
jgi:hypothetical protein